MASRTKELEFEAEAHRARIAETLEEIRSRLTPGQLVDQAIGYARDHGGGEFVRNLSDQVKRSPLPIALMATSIAWLMLSPRRTRRPSPPASSVSPSIVPSAYPEHDLDEEARIAERTAARAASGRLGRGVGTPHDLSAAANTHIRGSGSGSDSESDSQYTSSVRRGASSTYETAADIAGQARGAASDAASSVRRGVSSAYETAADIAGQARGAASDAASSVRRGVSSAYESAADTASRTSAAVSRTAQDTISASSELMHRARRSTVEQLAAARDAVRDNVREQPLVAGVLGITLGALIGALLPRTRTEDELVGGTSDSVKRAVKGAAYEQYQHANEASQRVYEKVKHEVEAQGLAANSVDDLLQTVKEKVGAIAEVAKEELKSEIDHISAQAPAEQGGSPRAGAGGAEPPPSSAAPPPESGPAPAEREEVSIVPPDRGGGMPG